MEIIMARGQKRCRCEATQKPRSERGWCTSELNCYITRTGRKFDSRRSRVVYPKCGASWRTSGAYAADLPHPQSCLPGLEDEQ